MTGGLVVVLGDAGINFGAGMTAAWRGSTTTKPPSSRRACITRTF
jgi:hypothetical protein